MKSVEIFTDGACSGNPGPGGWAAILICEKSRKEISGYEPRTTNNRMEISAAIHALEILKESYEVSLYSDSSYLVDAFKKGWLARWQHNGWLTGEKKDVLNQDLWKRLLELCSIHKIQFTKVKGHSSHPENNRCDELARKAIRSETGIVTETLDKPSYRLHSMILECFDVEQLADFYEKLLGWERYDQGTRSAKAISLSDPAEGVAISFRYEASYPSLVSSKKTEDRLTMPVLEFFVDDLDKAVRYAQHCGAVIANEQESSDIRRLFDPAGHPFNLITAKK